MIKRVIEWDKRRKFGHRFGDFVFLAILCGGINAIACCIADKINIPLLFSTAVVYGILVNRNPPDDSF